MVDHIPDIPADPWPKVQAGPPFPPVVKRALALVAHAGVSCGLGLLVGGLAGGVIGTGVGLIWFWGPPFVLAASVWIGRPRRLGPAAHPLDPAAATRTGAAQRGHLCRQRIWRLAAPTGRR